MKASFPAVTYERQEEVTLFYVSINQTNYIHFRSDFKCSTEEKKSI